MEQLSGNQGSQSSLKLSQLSRRASSREEDPFTVLREIHPRSGKWMGQSDMATSPSEEVEMVQLRSPGPDGPAKQVRRLTISDSNKQEEARRRRRNKRIGAPLSPTENGRKDDFFQSGTISNDLKRYGTQEDATCQVDARDIMGELPSETHIKEFEGAELRGAMQTGMPSATLGSTTLEQREIARLMHKPTLRELRTAEVLKSTNKIQLSIGRKARENRARQRQEMSCWQRFRSYTAEGKKRFKRLASNATIPFWRERIRHIESAFGGTYVAYFVFLRWLLVFNIFFFLYLFLLLSLNTIMTVNWDQVRIDVIPFIPGWSGTIDSFFFYGGYPSVGTFNYNMALAYILVTFCAFAICVFIFLARIRNLAINAMDTSGLMGEGTRFGQLLWTAYDYNVSDAKALAAMRLAISGAFKTMLTAEQVKKRRMEKASLSNQIKILAMRVCVNLAVLGLLALEAYLIYYFINTPEVSMVYIPGLSEQFDTTAFLITGLNLTLPIIFEYLTRFEGYEDRDTALVLEVARVYLVKIAGVYVLLFGYLDADTNPAFIDTMTSWETAVGKQFYNLMFTNAASMIFSTIGIALVFKFILKKPWNFSVSSHLLDLIYVQALVWTGFYFSPVLPFIAILTLFLVFYVKAFCLIKASEPPTELYSASRTSRFFFALLLFTLLVSAVPVGYAVTRMSPGVVGPHVGQTTAYEIVPALIRASSEGVTDFFTFLGTPTAVLIVLVVLMLWAYYLDTMRKRNAKRLAEIERELVREREDKRYLLRFYNIKF